MPSLARDGVTIAYQIHGSAGGIPLLLSHGYSASSTMWDPNLTALADDRQVVTWDLRGHGLSESPADISAYSQAASVADMAAILDAGGIDRAAVGGLSLGGYLSLAFHLVHPDRVAALVLVDTGPGFKSDEARHQWNRWAEARAESFEQAGMAALSDSPEAGLGPHNPTGLARAARGILRQHDADVISALPFVRIPTLVVVGSDDRPFLNAAEYMATRIPGAKKIVIANSGHAPNIENPTEFNDAVTTFLTEIE